MSFGVKWAYCGHVRKNQLECFLFTFVNYRASSYLSCLIHNFHDSFFFRLFLGISSACKVTMLQVCLKYAQGNVESNAHIMVTSECSDKIATSAPHKCCVVSFCALGQCNREIRKQCQDYFFLKLGHQCFLYVTSLVHLNADILMAYSV